MKILKSELRKLIKEEFEKMSAVKKDHVKIADQFQSFEDFDVFWKQYSDILMTGLSGQPLADAGKELARSFGVNDKLVSFVIRKNDGQDIPSAKEVWSALEQKASDQEKFAATNKVKHPYDGPDAPGKKGWHVN